MSFQIYEGVVEVGFLLIENYERLTIFSNGKYIGVKPEG
jgi:hypothetical protein